jgi:hypothetical protein
MSEEAINVCDALLALIRNIMHTEDIIPGGFELCFGDDELKITAKINLDYEDIRKNEDETTVFYIRNDGNDKKE